MSDRVIAKLIKIDSFQSSQTLYVSKGDVLVGYFRTWPIVGENFCFIQGTKPLTTAISDRPLFTTTVSEIIDDRTFKTKNSVYKIVTMEDERDEKIKIILE